MKNASARGSINIKLGGYYIIAPENGSAGTVNIGDWEQIWQYGSDLGEANADKMWEQDGVAPQSAVTGINADPALHNPRTIRAKKYEYSYMGGENF